MSLRKSCWIEPGPWRVYRRTRVHGGTEGSPAHVANCSPEHNSVDAETWAQCEANAALISTLPDVLKRNAELEAALNTALAEMVMLKARLSEPYRTNITKACDIAKAALAGEGKA